MMKRLTKLKFTKLKTPLTYVKFLKLIKSNEFKLTDYVQDIHIKEIFVFHPKMKFYKIKEYRNGSLILQDKVRIILFNNNNNSNLYFEKLNHKFKIRYIVCVGTLKRLVLFNTYIQRS